MISCGKNKKSPSFSLSQISWYFFSTCLVLEIRWASHLSRRNRNKSHQKCMLLFIFLRFSNPRTAFFLQTFVVNHLSSLKYARKYISNDTPKYFFKIYRGCECIKSTYQVRVINYALFRVLRFGLRNGQTSSRCQLVLISLDFTRNR